MPKERDYSSSEGFTLADLKIRNTERCCIISIRREVYDVTVFLDYHPGKSSVLERCGGSEIDDVLCDSNHKGVCFDCTLEKHRIKYLGILLDGKACPKNESLNNELTRRCAVERESSHSFSLKFFRAALASITEAASPALDSKI